jgi:hypothetical protein
VRQRASGRRDFLLMIALAGAAWLLSVPSPARAGGCHVPDRPALFRGLSWDHWPANLPAQVQDRQAVARAIPAFAAVPCHKDVSTVTPTASTLLCGQHSMQFCTDPPTAGERLPVRSTSGSRSPAHGRLDRPPRPL